MGVRVPNSPAPPTTWLNFTAAYQWDNEGRMTSLQYPTVSAVGSFGNMPQPMPTAGFQYDANGRLSEVTMASDSGPQWFASGTYTTAGQLYQLSYGPWTETRQYNSLLQLTNQTAPGYMNMTYNYSNGANNGRIAGSVDGITGENTTYTYDGLNRLTAAWNSMWSESYSYDAFGNLTQKSGSGGSPNPAPQMPPVSYDANNHQVGCSYDGNGNQTAANGTSNTFDVENRILTQTSGVWPYASSFYWYDPWGKRVMNETNADPNDYNNAWDPISQYNFYGITGQRLATVTCDGRNYPAYPTCSVSGQNVYFGRKLLTSNGVNVLARYGDRKSTRL